MRVSMNRLWSSTGLGEDASTEERPADSRGGPTARLVPLVVLASTLACGSIAAQPREEWVQTYTNGPEEHLGEKVAVDADGNVVVTGDGKIDGNRDIVTVKYDGDGSLLWARRFDGPAGDYDAPAGVGCDDAGFCYVGGSVVVVPGESGDAVVVKYDRDGNEAWIWRRRPAAGLSASALAIAVSDDGTVTLGVLLDGQGTLDSTVVEIDPDGRTNWSAAYGLGYVHDVARAPDGSSYAVGQTIEPGASPGAWSFTTVRYGPDGQTLWRDSVRFRIDVARAVALDPGGNVLVTGEAGAGRFLTTFTTKLDANGGRAWNSIIDGPGDFGDVGRDIVVDDDGNAYVASEFAGDVTGRDLAVVKLTPDGAVSWQYRYDGPDSDQDFPEAISLGLNGSVIVTGSSMTGGSYEAITIFLSADGEPIGIMRYDRASGFSRALDLAVDTDGAAYVTGFTHDAGQTRFLTIKYSISGARFRRGDCDGDGDVSGGVEDAVSLLLHSFSGGDPPPCLAACDVDGDGSVLGSVNDPIYLLRYHFLGGPPPVAPFPDCGDRTDVDRLVGCDEPPSAALCAGN